MMIHNVYFWFTDEAKGSVEREFEAALADLARIDVIQAAHVGQPAATESRPVTDHSWDYAIHFHFASLADHDAYQVHPDHDVFVQRCKDWWARVLVLDTAVE